MARKLKLLVVNAQEADTRLIIETLSPLDVFDIIHFKDTKKALHLLKNDSVDLIISAIDVGKIDGWRFARMVRSGLLKTAKHTPIVLVPPIYCERIAEVTARSYSIDAVLPIEKTAQLPHILANVLSTQLEKSSRLKLLLIEPSKEVAVSIAEHLAFDFELTHVDSISFAITELYQSHFSIVLLNTEEYSHDTLEDFIEQTLTHNPKQGIVTIIDSKDADHAERLLLLGVTDFVRAPYDLPILSKVCDHAARREDFMVSYGEFAQKVEQLSRSEAKYKELFSAHQRILIHLNTVVAELDIKGNVQFLNPVWEQISGKKLKDSLKQDLASFFTPSSALSIRNTIQKLDSQPHNKLELELIHLKGHHIWVECRFQLIRNSTNILAITATIENIHERKQAELQLKHLALHDTLTGLHNRYYFDQQLHALCQQVVYSETQQHALLYIDLDHFKLINDSQGHQQGDYVLKEVAELFNQHVADHHLVFRIGGDEFAILLHHTDTFEAERIAKEICHTIERYKFNFENTVYSISCSIGLSLIDAANRDPKECLKQADIALYVAKDLGRNLVHSYQAQDTQSSLLQKGLEWGHHVKLALQNKDIELHYQPIWSFSQHKVAYFEALLRLRINGKLIYPNQFIPALEHLQDTFLMDHTVIDSALEALAQFPELTQVAINLSASSFLDERLVPHIKNSFLHYKVDPNRVRFELTESAGLNNLNATQAMFAELGELGCHFSIDDFGTGFSTFNYLKQLPAQHVKIDGSFVRDMLNDSIDLALVKAVNDISHSLGKASVAEYVETQEIFNTLKDIGFDYAQGYFIAKPQPISELLNTLKTISFEKSA